MPIVVVSGVPLLYHVTVGAGEPLAEQLSCSVDPGDVYTVDGRGANVGGLPVTASEARCLSVILCGSSCESKHDLTHIDARS